MKRVPLDTILCMECGCNRVQYKVTVLLIKSEITYFETVIDSLMLHHLAAGFITWFDVFSN